MNYFLEQALMIPLSFSFELLAAELMFCFYLPRRDRFWLRSIPLWLIFLVGTYDMPFYTIGDLPTYRFLLTFLLTIPMLAFGFQASLISVTFCAVAGYACRTFAMNIINLATSFWPDSFMLGGYSYTYNTVLIIPVYALLYLVFARRMKNHSMDIENRRLVMLSMLIVLLNTMMEVEWWSKPLPAKVISLYYGLMCGTLVLMLQFQFFQEKTLRNQNLVLEEMLAREQEKYELSRRNIELLNMKAHDLKHALTILKQHDNAATIRQLEQDMEATVSGYDAVPNTGHIALDTIIYEKSLQFSELSIEFSCIADGSLLKQMADPDIYALFGNILTNALTQGAKEPPEKRFISLSVTNRANCLYIHQDNYCSVPVQFEDGTPKTKGDPNVHGFGTRSIRYIAEKYSGYVTFTLEDGRFNVDILIPLSAWQQAK